MQVYVLQWIAASVLHRIIMKLNRKINREGKRIWFVQDTKTDYGNNKILKLKFYKEHVKIKCFNLHKEKR